MTAPWRARLVAGMAVGVLCLGLTACGGSSAGTSGKAAASSDPAAAFKGKTLTVIVPYNPGGGYDAFMRILAPKLEKQLDGARVRVENRPGGGGLIGANAVYEAKPDGLTIGLINYPGAVFAAVSGKEGVALDNSKWTFLGRLGAIPPLVYTGKDSGYNSFEDMINAKKPVVFGIGGVGSDAYYATAVLAKVLGFPNKIVAGYPGSGEADAALVAGEVDASVNSGGAAIQTIKGSGAQPMVFVSTTPNKELPAVPLITAYGDAAQQQTLTALASIYDLERIVVGPPGINDDVADYLAKAIFDAASDPSYETEMAKAGYEIAPLGREDTKKIAESASGAIDELTPIIKGASG